MRSAYCSTEVCRNWARTGNSPQHALQTVSNHQGDWVLALAFRLADNLSSFACGIYCCETRQNFPLIKRNITPISPPELSTIVRAIHTLVLQGQDIRSMFQAIAESIFEPGVNSQLLKAINITFVCLFVVVIFLLIALGLNIHLLVLLILSTGLLLSVNW